MGFCVFTLEFNDGSRRAYVTGNAVDFVDLPAGQGPQSIRRVIPHAGRDQNPRPGAEYSWCLFSRVSGGEG